MSGGDHPGAPPPFQPPMPWPGGLVSPSDPESPPPPLPPPPGGPTAPGPPPDGEPEPSLSFSLDGWLAEVGGAFQGTIAYQPMAGESGRATGIRLRLAFRTYGPGNPVRRVPAEQRWTMEPGDPFVTSFLVRVPDTEPISYDGELVALRWHIEVAATRPWRGDHSVVADVVVVPVGGASLYRTPHPYRPMPG